MIIEKNLERNVPRDYLYTLLANVDLTRGIWMLYLAHKGMSLVQLGLLETIFHMTSFSMEVPTGVVADVFGRRTSRTLGRLLSLISVWMLFTAEHFFGFALSFVLTALSYNLESGAGEALIYDSMKAVGTNDAYMAVAGKKEVFYQLASTTSFLVGGMLAQTSYPMAFRWTLVFAALAFLWSFRFEEPPIRKAGERHPSFSEQIKASLAVIRVTPRVAFLIGFTQGIAVFTTTLFYYMQNYLKGLGSGEASIGMLYAVSSLGAALIALKAPTIEQYLGERKILTMAPFLVALALGGVALSPWPHVFFLILFVMESLLYVALSDYLNRLIPSDQRATVLSFSSMVFSLFMIVLFPLVGWIGQAYSLPAAFLIMASIAMVLALINWRRQTKNA